MTFEKGKTVTGRDYSGFVDHTKPSLSEFLLARIAEDEAALRAILRWPESVRGFPGVWERRLAKCEADRRIVELHDVLSWTYRKPQCSTCADNENADYDGAPLIDWPCPTLRLLALPYADHLDYDEAWRP